MRTTVTIFAFLVAVALAYNNCGTNAGSCVDGSKTSSISSTTYAGFMDGNPSSLSYTSTYYQTKSCLKDGLVYEVKASSKLTKSSDPDQNGFTTYTIGACTPTIYFKTTEKSALNAVGFLYTCDCNAGSTCDLTKTKCYLLNQQIDYGKIVCAFGSISEGYTLKLKFNDQGVCTGSDNSCTTLNSSSGCIIPVWSIVLIVIVCLIALAVIIYFISMHFCKKSTTKCIKKTKKAVGK